MRPDRCQLALRPRDPLESIDLSLAVIRLTREPLGRLAVCTIAPLWVLGSVALWLTDGHLAVALLPVLAAPVIQAPVTVLLGQSLFEGDVTLRHTARRVGASAWRLGMVWLAVALGLVGSGLTAFTLWPMCAVALMYVTEAVLLEQVSLGRALRRSTRLASRSISHAVVGNLLRYGLFLWLWAGSEQLGDFVLITVLQLGAWLPADWSLSPFGLLGMLVSQFAWSVIRLLLYIDVRTRTEGWDLQVGLLGAAGDA